MEILPTIVVKSEQEKEAIPGSQGTLRPEPDNQGEVVVSVSHVSKKFCRNLRRSMAYGIVDLAQNLLGMQPNTTTLRKDEFWALDDVSFELRRGETLGIIGVNGSGKTTLLRLLTGIFPPDKGEILLRGRVGALVAIGAGFHPHMTGRENISLNGTILGMSRKEIKEKFDDIVAFAEVGKFLDAPVSTYSSGMRVRLGFSIAVHLQPDILLVDEVLSVGDITFQKKATEKIQELKKWASTIFVSHSMRHVHRICDRAMVLDNGKIEKIGDVEQVVTYYINKNIKRPEGQDGIKILKSIDSVEVLDMNFYDVNDNEAHSFSFAEKISIKIIIQAKEQINDVLCSIAISSAEGSIITTINAEGFPFHLKRGRNVLKCVIHEIRLIPNSYHARMKLLLKYGGLLVEIDAGIFEIQEIPGFIMPRLGTYREKAHWEIEQ